MTGRDFTTYMRKAVFAGCHAGESFVARRGKLDSVVGAWASAKTNFSVFDLQSCRKCLSALYICLS